jgi:hypothetical protein
MAISFISGYPIAVSTGIQHKFPEIQSISAAGEIREIVLGTIVLSKLQVKIEQLTEVEKNALVDWLMANRAVEIDLPVSNGHYIGKLDKSGTVRESITSRSSHLWDVEFEFYGVRQ